MSRWKILATYLLIGPLIGGLTVAVWLSVAVPPDSPAQWAELLAISLMFAYPYGALAAAAAGSTHASLARRTHAAALTMWVMLAGLLGHGLSLVLLGNKGAAFASPTAFVGFIAPALVSALLVAVLILRRDRQKN